MFDVDTSRPDPLDSAMKLSKLLLDHRGTDKSAVWRVIGTEQERLLYEHHKFHKWELLASLQAVVLYLLMRIVEGRQVYTNFDAQLLVTMNAVCTLLKSRCGPVVTDPELQGHMIGWHEWAFQESRRRTLAMGLLIYSIHHVELAIPCPRLPEYLSAPLPSRRSLWQASNEVDWAIDYYGYLQEAAERGFLTHADLASLKEGELDGEKTLRWDRWYAGADAFGLLVALAAKLRPAAEANARGS